MQNTNVTYSNTQSKMAAFHRKLKIWNECVLRGKLNCFKNLRGFILTNEITVIENVKVSI